MDDISCRGQLIFYYLYSKAICRLVTTNPRALQLNPSNFPLKNSFNYSCGRKPRKVGQTDCVVLRRSRVFQFLFLVKELFETSCLVMFRKQLAGFTEEISTTFHNFVIVCDLESYPA